MIMFQGSASQAFSFIIQIAYQKVLLNVDKTVT